MNRSMGFYDVVAARMRRLGCERRYHLAARQRFDPLGLLDLIRMNFCFARSNERVAARFGIRLGVVTFGTAVRELLATTLHDSDSLHRKQFLRALQGDDVSSITRSQASKQVLITQKGTLYNREGTA
jgi:hypothetical protein